MSIIWLLKLCVAYLLPEHSWAQYTALPRWGQATALVDNILLVHGGKTDQFNSYSYTSAPSNNDVLYLSLGSSFDTSSTPWQLVSSSANVSTSQGPSLAWHTLSALNTTDILLFGGQLDPNSPMVLPGVADSAFVLNINNPTEPEWIIKATSWANEPIRRMRHTSSSANGKVYVIGGERADGSNQALSDHYVFDMSIPSFALLPSSNAPPDLFGHAAVVLDNGSLVVFGGYCGSQAALLPLTAIWMMDTTQPTPQWSLFYASSTTIPSPRQAFAAASFGNGSILIHGGVDAPFQNTYSDGWMLDTTQNPMVWSQLDALSQLGARHDHFAITSGSHVVFGFGYSASAAAPAALQIFDFSSNQWTTSFTPPPLPPTNTLANPSQTSTPGMNKGGSPTSGSTGSGTATPDPHNTGQSTDSNSHRTAVVMGVTFGTLGLLAGGMAAAYFLKKRRNESKNPFRMLGTGYGDGFRDDQDSMHAEGDIPMIVSVQPKSPGSRWLPGLAIFGREIQGARVRRDMLADEDTRQFWHYGLEGGVGSTWSLRNVGAMIGERIGMKSREPSIQSPPGTPWREKSDPFSDGVGLMREEESRLIEPPSPTMALRSHSRRYQSYSSGRSYSDPFADPLVEENWDDLYGDLGRTTNNRGTKSFTPVSPHQLHLPQTLLPLSTTAQPPTAQSSRNTFTESFISQDQAVSSFDASSQTTSNTSHGDKLVDTPSPASLHQPVSIDYSSAQPANPIRRSDSWWLRFARTSLLDRRSSDAGRSHPRILNIRDPNPAPRLVTIKESTHSNSGSRPGSHSQQGSQLYDFGHRQSTSSLQTTLTADTLAIEKFGVMDVVQRVMTPSHRASTSIASITDGQHFPSGNDFVEGPLSLRTHLDTPVALSPTEMTPAETSLGPNRPSSPHTPPHNLFSGSSPRNSPGSGVASRVQEYERRMSQDLELSGSPTSPSSRNTRRREEKSRDKIITVNYGLAPRPNLYVANPDHLHGASSSSTS